MKKSSKILVAIIVLVMASLCVGLFYYLIVKNPVDTDNANGKSGDLANVSTNEVTNKTEEVDEDGEVYALITRDVYADNVMLDEEQTEMLLYEYNNSNKDYAEIYYSFHAYSTDPSYKYSLSVKDENNNEILINEEEQILGVISIARIEKVSLDQTLTFSMREILDNDVQEVTSVVVTKINLKEDIEDIEKIEQLSDIDEVVLGDISLKYLKDENAKSWPIGHSYSTELVGEIFSSNINVQYGNSLISCENLTFSYEKNVNNLTAQEAFESLALITRNAGEYGISDLYGLHISNEQGEIMETVVVTFEEMIDLCNGLSVEKDGVEYTGEDFNFEKGRRFVKEEKIEIVDGIEAIKYSAEYDDNIMHYIFEYNGNIYNLSLPINERVEEVVDYILDNMEIVK